MVRGEPSASEVTGGNFAQQRIHVNTSSKQVWLGSVLVFCQVSVFGWHALSLRRAWTSPHAQPEKQGLDATLDDFELYRVVRAFRKQIYRLIKQLPVDEKYALANQMRRAAISVTNNIAEGHGRWHYQENIQFCRIARGSIDELIDDLNICHDESYGDYQWIETLKVEAYNLNRRMHGYIAYLKRSKQGGKN